MQKITFFIYSLRTGGAERVITQISNQLITKGFEIEILTIDDVNNFLGELNTSVKVVSLNKDRIIKTIIPVYRYLKKSNSDFFVTNIWPLTLISSLLSIVFRNKKFVLIEHCNIFDEFKYKGSFFILLMKASILFLYGLNHKIVAVSDGVKNSLIRCNPFINKRTTVIYNPVRSNPVNRLHKDEKEFVEFKNYPHKKLIAVGSLNHQKNYPHLLRSLKKVKKENIAFLCYIIGEGELFYETEALIRELKLDDCVKCLGHKADPREYIELSDLLILSSFAEGFGLVLAEAMQCGVTPVSSDCRSGPAEIIGSNYGFLSQVNDDEDLARNILFALENKISPDLLKKRASLFDEQKVSLNYVKLFKDLDDDKRVY